MAITTQVRPQRWDQPFGLFMTDQDVERLLAIPEISAIEESKFPSHCPLRGILKNDARIVKYTAGDIVIREGDYGNSAFLVLDGSLKVVLFPGLPGEMLGRQTIRKKTLWQAFKQLWNQRKTPEVRNIIKQYQYSDRGAEALGSSHVFLQDVPTILDENNNLENWSPILKNIKNEITNLINIYTEYGKNYKFFMNENTFNSL